MTETKEYTATVKITGFNKADVYEQLEGICEPDAESIKQVVE